LSTSLNIFGESRRRVREFWKRGLERQRRFLDGSGDADIRS
jgi:hypothetical protein